MFSDDRWGQRREVERSSIITRRLRPGSRCIVRPTICLIDAMRRDDEGPGPTEHAPRWRPARSKMAGRAVSLCGRAIEKCTCARYRGQLTLSYEKMIHSGCLGPRRNDTVHEASKQLPLRYAGIPRKEDRSIRTRGTVQIRCARRVAICARELLYSCYSAYLGVSRV